MKKRVLCLALAVFMLMGCLVACGGGGEVPPTQEKTDNWEDVDFQNSTLTVCVSINPDDQVTFGAADKYTKGPDKATTETVQKKVLARNKKVADDLNIKIEWQTKDLSYSEVYADVEQLVANDADDAPDIYNNDIYGLTNCMLDGFLWNVSDPGYEANGTKAVSFFDFDHECWYLDYMKGSSLSADKLYMVVGDYNIDIIRFAWVFFVNKNLWDGTFSNTEYGTYEEMCDYINDTHDWFYDDIIILAGQAHNDAGGAQVGITDKEDAQIGFCFNDVGQRIFVWGSGVSIYEWTKNGKTVAPGYGTPSLRLQTDIEAFTQLGNKYTELYNAKGVLAKGVAVKDSTTLFMDGKIVMSMAELGEMESEEMRNTPFSRGIIPFPRYQRNYTDGITTVVHDQAEIDTILNNAKSFNMASAYLQYVNELSVDILDTYYEEVLKFKYNDSKGARMMIDLVHDSIDSPFDSVMSAKIFGKAGSQLFTYFQQDATANRDSTFSSRYQSNRDAVQGELEKMLDSFNKLQ